MKIMKTLKHFIATLLCVSLSMSLTQAQPASGVQQETQTTNPSARDLLIIIQQEQVRFTTQRTVAEIQLQIFDQAGQLVYDSGAISGPELTWVLRQANGEAVKSGLYAYALSIKEAGAATARVRRGHFIVDRAKERDGQKDRLWVTSQNDSGVGTELTVARNEGETVAGASITNEHQGVKAGDKEQSEGEVGSKTKSDTKEAALASSAVNGKTTIQGSEDPLLEIDHLGAAGHPALWFKQDGATKAYMWWDRVYGHLNLGTPTTNPIMSLQDNGTVNISGRVGIGNTPLLPFYKLQVRALGNHTGVFAESTGDGAGVHGQSAYSHGVRGTTNGNGAGIYGEVGFGGTGHAGVFQGKVFINGSLTVHSSVLPYVDNATFTLGSATQRWKAVYAVNGAIQTSDARLKRDVTNLRYGLRELLQLRPVSFAWKDPSDQQQHLGLIAQETEQIIPEAVAREADPATSLGLNYTALIPVVIKAIQEQQTTITVLKSENEALHRQNTTLHQQNTDLDVRLKMLEQRMPQLMGQSQRQTSEIKRHLPQR
jgi:hypothetical protein